MTDQELNEAVARKLGYKKLFDGPSTPERQTGWGTPDYDGLSGAGRWMLNPPDFFHSIAAAWEIVEHLNKDGLRVRLEQDWHGNNLMMIFRKGDQICETPNWEDTAPMAMCLAFLKVDTSEEAKT